MSLGKKITPSVYETKQRHKLYMAMMKKAHVVVIIGAVVPAG